VPNRLLIATAALAASVAGVSVAARGADTATPAVSAATTAFVPIDELTVPIAGTQRVEGALRARIVLGAASASDASAMSARLPEIRAAAVTSMIEFSRLYATGLTPVDAVRLRADLTAGVRAVDPAIADVLITEVAATRA
jgi:hypothetical protein